MNYRTTNPQGELVWFHQFTSDDVGTTKDWDADCGPFLVTIKDRKAVIVGTKEGKLYALDRALGTLIWKSVLTNPNPTGSVLGGLTVLHAQMVRLYTVLLSIVQLACQIQVAVLLLLHQLLLPSECVMEVSNGGKT